ncbi:oxidoreductase [Rossellomorea marisflavi]|uniref:oxidoreductase n=1 Tax=Rossellomorea marisflavi TaxID=189381 RepID=UPI00345A6FB9
MEGKVALIAGATGMVGSRLVRLLLDSPRYDKVISIVRRESGVVHEKLDERVQSLDDMRLEPGETIDDVYCCLGTTIKKAKSQEAFKKVDHGYPLQLAELGKTHGAKQFLLISSMGADVDSRFFYSRVKGMTEGDITALGYSTLHIFRPSLLLGERAEFRFGEKMGEVASRLLQPLMRGKLRKYRSIEGAQVARGMLSAASGRWDRGVLIWESDAIQEL